MGNQLLRMAIQKTIGDLSLAHKLWDMLIEQVSTKTVGTAEDLDRHDLRCAAGTAPLGRWPCIGTLPRVSDRD